MSLGRVRAAMAARQATVGDEPPVAPAATLLALYEESAEVRLILTRRTGALPIHPGEISLPGGRADAGESMVAAALREAAEEVGIPPDAVEVVGWLEPVTGRTTGSVAVPVVGLLTSRPHLRLDPGEVDAAFDVSVSDLLAEGVYHEELWDVPVTRPVHFFELPELTVWGMTARILHQFLTLVLASRPVPD